MLDNIIYPNALCAVVIEEHLWFMNHVANSLMKMRLSDGVITEWYQIEPYDLLASTLFHDMVHYGDWLILIPDVCGRHIVYFDLRTKEQQSILLPDDWRIARQLVLDGRIFFFSKLPAEQMKIFELDMESRMLQRDDSMERSIAGLIPDEAGWNCRAIDMTYGFGRAWMLITGTGYLVEIDLRNRAGKVHTIGDGVYGKITYSGQELYISDNRECKIYRWAPNTGLIETIESGKYGGSDGHMEQYVSLCYHNSNVICVPRFSPWVDIFDGVSGTQSRLRVDTDQNIFPIAERVAFPFYQSICVFAERFMIVLANAGRDFFMMNFDSGEAAEIRPVIPKSFYDKAAKELTISVLSEENLRLDKYLDYIQGIGDQNGI